MNEKSRLDRFYTETVVPNLKKKCKFKNVMQVPRLSKIIINVGVKEAVADSGAIKLVADIITKITGQRPVKTKAKKSIAGFKLREGVLIGVKVTLRRRNMYEFMDRLISLALPKVRDFQGLNFKMDGRGNYNLGIKEWMIFPEVDYAVVEKSHGINITFDTTSRTDEFGLELLRELGLPFKVQGERS